MSCHPLLPFLSLRKRPLVLALAASVLGSPVLAQSDFALEEVIVTAQKRAENVQDVPIAITALSASDLEDKGAVSLVDVGSFAPNVQLDKGAFLVGSSQVMTAYIRGIGQRDIAAGLEPGVGVYVDGVFLSRSTGANVDLLDVERVEVLKGPQGTLFGRNTIGGAVSVVTRRPSEELSGKINVSVGNDNLREVKGTVDIPLSDSLFSQFAFSSTDQDGYQKIRQYPGDPNASDEPTLLQSPGASANSSDTRGGLDHYNLRGKLLWQLTDDTEMTLVVDYAKADEEAGAISLVDEGIVAGATDTTYAAVYNACVGLPEEVINVTPLVGICGPRAYATGVLDGLASESPATRLMIAPGLYDTGDIDVTYGNGGNSSKVESSGVALTLQHDFGWGLLKSITAYRELESRTINDVDGTPVNASTTNFYMDHEQWSQELQLNIDNEEGTWRSVAGLYLFHEESVNEESAFIGEGLGNFYGPYSTDVDSFAVYFNTNYALTESLSLTFGARYTEDEKSFEVGQRDWNLSTIKLGLSLPESYPTDDLTLIAAPGTVKDDYDDFSYRLGAEYFINPDVMMYLSFSQGFKSGGIATRLSGPTDGNLPLTFDPETAETWELGIKSRLLNDRVQVNAALFSTDYEDMQITYSVGISPFFDNAGKATIEGMEVELVARLAPSLRLSAAMGYLDASYDQLDDNIINNTPINLRSKLVNVPEWSGSVSLTWDVAEVAQGSVRVNLDYLYKDDMARDSENTSFAFAKSYEIVNANISWDALNSGWSFSIWGKNLTDERYITSTSYVPAVGVPGNSYNRPREYGIALGYQF